MTQRFLVTLLATGSLLMATAHLLDGGVEPAAAVLPAIELDPRAIPSGSDTYEFAWDGRKHGRLVVRRTREGGELVLREQTTMGQSISETTTMRLDADSLAMRSLVMTGEIQGERVDVGLRWEGSRVRGHTLFPEPRKQGFGPARRTEIDCELPAGTMERNSLYTLVQALPMEPGKTWNLAVFSALDGALEDATLSVGERAEIEVPAGRFVAWPVTLLVGEKGRVFHVSVQEPRRVLKIEALEQPLVFELTR